MKEIKLRGRYGFGKVALVDDEDFEKVNEYKWYIHMNRYFSAPESVQASMYLKRTTIKIHRLIMNITSDRKIDHKNGNPLDNRKENLRSCTSAENSRNRKLNVRSKSGYKGVIFYKGRSKPWRGEIRVDGKNIILGYFQTKEEAALAYNISAIKHFGEFAKLNVL